MDMLKLDLSITEAEGAIAKLKQAVDHEDKIAINTALDELQDKLRTIKEITKADSGTSHTIDSSSTAKKYVGWRVLHQAEGGYDKNPLNMPEVIPPLNPTAVEMTEAIQKMSFELMQHFNPQITGKLWTKVHHQDRAFTNFNGFAKKSDPRANHVLGENLSKPLPKYDKAQRLCGGQFVRGEVRGDKLVCVPGVHGIDANGPMPSIQTIVDNNWYLHAITLFKKASDVGHFPQGKGGAVVMPFIFKKEIEFELKLFEKWESDELPDPLKMYKLE